MTINQLKAGIIGTGFIGPVHLEALRRLGVRVAALCDVPERVRAAADRFDIPDAFGDYRELLQSPNVDVVHITAPNRFHCEMSLAALRAGKHVVCEKPLARNAAQAGEILKAARSAPGFFMPAMCIRFWPEWVWLKRAVEQNTYGKVLTARFRRVSEPPGWSRDSYFKGDLSGGALLDLHIHDTDFVQHVFGRPQSVYTTGVTVFSGAVDAAVTQYKVACGASVYAEGNWIMKQGHGFNMAYTVNFEKATVDYDLSRGAEALKVCEEGRGASVVKCEGPDGYVGELRHMVESILANKPPTVVTAEDGFSAVEICESEEKSVKTGQIVVL